MKIRMPLVLLGLLLFGATVIHTQAQDEGGQPPAAPCATNFTVVVGQAYTLQPMISGGSCTGLQHPTSGSWSGTCMIGAGTNCNSIIGGSQITVWMNLNYDYPKTNDVNVGTASVACANGSGDSKPMIVPAGCPQCTFSFVVGCSGTNCALTVCRSCEASSFGQ